MKIRKNSNQWSGWVAIHIQGAISTDVIGGSDCRNRPRSRREKLLQPVVPAVAAALVADHHALARRPQCPTAAAEQKTIVKDFGRSIEAQNLLGDVRHERPAILTHLAASARHHDVSNLPTAHVGKLSHPAANVHYGLPPWTELLATLPPANDLADVMRRAQTDRRPGGAPCQKNLNPAQNAARRASCSPLTFTTRSEALSGRVASLPFTSASAARHSPALGQFCRGRMNGAQQASRSRPLLARLPRFVVRDCQNHLRQSEVAWQRINEPQAKPPTVQSNEGLRFAFAKGVQFGHAGGKLIGGHDGSVVSGAAKSNRRQRTAAQKSRPGRTWSCPTRARPVPDPDMVSVTRGDGRCNCYSTRLDERPAGRTNYRC